MPKSIELNSESEPKLILVFGFGLGVTQDSDPTYSFFLAECLVSDWCAFGALCFI